MAILLVLCLVYGGPDSKAAIPLVRTMEIPWIHGFEHGLEVARTAGRPAFVYFHAAWCSWCHVYERDTLDATPVREALLREFVPVLEDFDARPDLVARFAARGLPLTVVLSPKGEVLLRLVGVLSPQDLLNALSEKVRPTPYQRDSASLIARVTGLDRPGFERFQKAYLDHLETLYDPALGILSAGVYETGLTNREPSPRAWMYLMAAGVFPNRGLRAARVEVERLMDPVDGGFFNFVDPYARESDYLESSKLLEQNAWMSAWLAKAGVRYDDPRLRTAARSGYDYLRKVLFDPEQGGFYRAQWADNDYYKLTPDKRLEQAPPPLVRAFRTDLNAQTAFALVHFGTALDEPDAHRLAARAMDFILQQMLHNDALYHIWRDGNFGALRNRPDDLFWVLAAGVQVQGVLPDVLRKRQLVTLAERAGAWLSEAMVADPSAARQPVARLSLIAWVASQRESLPDLPEDGLLWALKGLRIDSETSPDAPVLGFTAWNRFLTSVGRQGE